MLKPLVYIQDITRTSDTCTVPVQFLINYKTRRKNNLFN